MESELKTLEGLCLIEFSKIKNPSELDKNIEGYIYSNYIMTLCNKYYDNLKGKNNIKYMNSVIALKHAVCNTLANEYVKCKNYDEKTIIAEKYKNFVEINLTEYPWYEEYCDDFMVKIQMDAAKLCLNAINLEEMLDDHREMLKILKRLSIPPVSLCFIQ